MSTTVDGDEHWMQQALQLARQAGEAGEVPVGAVIVKDDSLIAQGMNRCIRDSDPTAHAEMVALRAAGRALANYRIPDTTLYVTLEPCAMCFGALVHARVARVVFGAADPKAGALSVLALEQTNGFNHRFVVSGGVLAEDCGELLRTFFKARR